MHLLIVVPARIGSSRLREKPLRLLRGDLLIRHVVRTVLQWDFSAPVVVATDDARVVEAVEPLGVLGILTGPEHPSGTHRVAEVAELPRFRGVDTILNVQGDLPSVPRDVALAALRRLADGDPIGTVGVPLSPEALGDGSRVKVAVDSVSARALCFSRSVPASLAWRCDVDVLEHVGVYAYTREALRCWVQLPADPEEQAEGLEQIRPLAHGIPVGVARWMGQTPLSIDTELDLVRAQAEVTLIGHGGSG